MSMIRQLRIGELEIGHLRVGRLELTQPGDWVVDVGRLLPELLEVVPPSVVVVGSRVVVVVGSRVVVVVGRTVEVVVEVVAGMRPAVATGARGRGGRVVVDETPANRLRWRLVVDGATACGGARLGEASTGPAGVVRNPSRLPPPAPSATATTRVAHRRSRLNRTAAPVCELLR
jgi:hypothetical protein